jgi:hypothetical protein
MTDNPHEGDADDEVVDYDPATPAPPAREPPRRSTAPQSDFTTGQVGLGFLVLVVGLAITVGLPIALA